MAGRVAVLGDWNSTIPAAPAGSDNIQFAVNRSGPVTKYSASVRRATSSHYGTIIYDSSGAATKYLGADGNWHDYHGVPSGGTTGQVLKKNSNTDYDLVWGSGGGGGEDFENWDEAIITRSGTAFSVWGCNQTYTSSGSGGAGLSSIFDDGLPKMFANGGGTINSKSLVCEETGAHIRKFYPRTRFLCDIYYRGLATEGPMIAYYGLMGETGANMLSVLDSTSPSADKVVAFCMNSSTDTNWQAVASSGTAVTKVDTGVPITLVHGRAEIRWDLAFTSIDFLINDVVVATISTNLPSASTAMCMCFGQKTLDAANRALRCAYLKILQTMKAA